MKRIVVFSGAGMSAESGIATFRGANGLWEGYRIEEVATPQAWAADAQRVTTFYNMRRKNVVQAEPNEGHRTVAALEARYRVDVVTQNIDDLHERAGSTHVLHLHGEIMKLRSERNVNDVITLDGWQATLDAKCKLGGRYRPHIVWFGEEVPMLERAAAIVASADILVVVGTSLMVYPAAGLVHYAPAHCKVVTIDPALEALPGKTKATMIKKGASEGMRELAEMLM